jgi:hypothetical protein
MRFFMVEFGVSRKVQYGKTASSFGSGLGAELFETQKVRRSVDRAIVTIGGKQVAIKYHGHGYVTDENSHDIDWLYDQEWSEPDLTDKEEQSVIDQLYKIVADRGSYEGPEDASGFYGV